MAYQMAAMAFDRPYTISYQSSIDRFLQNCQKCTGIFKAQTGTA